MKRRIKMMRVFIIGNPSLQNSILECMKNLPSDEFDWDDEQKTVIPVHESDFRAGMETFVLDHEIQLIAVVAKKGLLPAHEDEQPAHHLRTSHTKCRAITIPSSNLSIHIYARVLPDKRTDYFDQLCNADSSLTQWGKQTLKCLEEKEIPA